MKEILNIINDFDTIIIHRHSKPDMDAIGSQFGLKYILEEEFPNKKIYCVGDLNDMSYKAKTDRISDETYINSLSIITDVSVSRMVSDNRFVLSKKRIVIDHHDNDCDIENVDINYNDTSFNSVCEMIIEIFKKEKISFTKKAATYLYAGMITDSGRFLYLKNPKRTFELASYVCSFKPDIEAIYRYLYTEKLAKRLIKNKFSQFELSSKNVAYRINTMQEIKSTGLEFQSVSRGMVNLMAGIIEIPIWCSFSEKEKDRFVVELRSREYSVIDVAKKYGGGGHKYACGATIRKKDIKIFIKDLDKLITEGQNEKEWNFKLHI